MRVALVGAIWTGPLIGSNWLVFLAGPKIGQVSGNGFPPEEAAAALLSVLLTLGWIIWLRRTAGHLSSNISEDTRIKASVVGWILGVGLILWGFGVSNHYQERFHEQYRRDMPTPYAVTYGFAIWQFWAGLGCAALATGFWRGERQAGRRL